MCGAVCPGQKGQSRMLLLPAGVSPSNATRVSLDVAERPGVLLRVLGVCQRRGARVLAMSYGCEGDHALIELAISADERMLRLLVGRLAALVEVRSVSLIAS